MLTLPKRAVSDAASCNQSLATSGDEIINLVPWKGHREVKTAAKTFAWIKNLRMQVASGIKALSDIIFHISGEHQAFASHSYWFSGPSKSFCRFAATISDGNDNFHRLSGDDSAVDFGISWANPRAAASYQSSSIKFVCGPGKFGLLPSGILPIPDQLFGEVGQTSGFGSSSSGGNKSEEQDYKVYPIKAVVSWWAGLFTGLAGILLCWFCAPVFGDRYGYFGALLIVTGLVLCFTSGGIAAHRATSPNRQSAGAPYIRPLPAL